MRMKALCKAVAFVMWADEKIETDEWNYAESIFKKYKSLAFSNGDDALNRGNSEFVRHL